MTKNRNHNFKNQSDNNFELGDFIEDETQIKIGSKIDPKAKILNFSHIEVSAIDPKIRQELADLTKNIRNNLTQLKLLNR